MNNLENFDLLKDAILNGINFKDLVIVKLTGNLNNRNPEKENLSGVIGECWIYDKKTETVYKKQIKHSKSGFYIETKKYGKFFLKK